MGAIAIICQLLFMKTNKSPELLSAGAIPPDKNWRMPPHRHPFHHEVIVVLGGTMLLKTPTEKILAGKGDVLFYRAGMVHEEISTPSSPVSTLYLAFRFSPTPDYPLQLHDAEGRVRLLISWLYQDFHGGRRTDNCQSLLAAILNELHQLSLHPTDPWVLEILAHMKEAFASELTLDDLARRGQMTRSAFVRKFKKLHGHTPMEQLRMIRLTEARNMMLGSGLPLKAIAPAVGLGDEYQLSKLFRRYFGISPRQMRVKSSYPTA